MSLAQLSLVKEPASSPGARAIVLMREARMAGEEQVTDFLATLELVVRQAQEIAEGGDVYPPGVRDVCAKLVEHTGYRAQAIYSIMRPHSAVPPSLRAAEVPAADDEVSPSADAAE